MSITIHSAALSDCEAVYPLICQLTSGGWKGSGGEYQPSYENFSKTYEQVLGYGNKRYFIAKNGDEIVGVAGLTVNLTLSEAGHFVYIDELVVDEANRGKNIGQMLLSACINFAKEHNYQITTVNTGMKRYAAQSLYEKNGFLRVGLKYVFDSELPDGV